VQEYTVYWIHHKNHTDIFSQGYVGVTNNTKKRFAKHKAQANQSTHNNPIITNASKKYGWENIIFSIVLISDKLYCLEFEHKLRPNKEIGWNIAPGGGMPNVRYGKDNPMCDPKIAIKVSNTKKGIATRGYGWHHSEETRKKLSKNSGNKKGIGKKVVVGDMEFVSQQAAAKHFNIDIRTFKKRYKNGEL